jgi:hypothetical protein
MWSYAVDGQLGGGSFKTGERGFFSSASRQQLSAEGAKLETANDLPPPGGG